MEPGRILDIPCKVCGDFSSGKHYNIFACDGCAGFFKRSIRRNRQYVCKAKEEGTCVIDKTHRNQCRACRLQKCQEAGMNRDAVQHERGPRNSTLRRQHISNYMYEVRERYGIPHPSSVSNRASATAGVTSASSPLEPPRGLLSLPLPRLETTPTHARAPHTANSRVESQYALRMCRQVVAHERAMGKDPPIFHHAAAPRSTPVDQRKLEGNFVLNVAQTLPITDLSSLVHASGVLSRDNNPIIFLQQVHEFQWLMNQVKALHLDQYEFSYIKHMLLFKTSFEKPCSSSCPAQDETKVLSEPAKVKTLHNTMQDTLKSYVEHMSPGEPQRFGKLSSLPSSLKDICTKTIEDLFFRKTIGNATMVKVICDMYKSQPRNI
ncbi:hypothetical protein NQ318_018158 [Aromia moschata]|uniref:Nuclear receptor domain-containing protein n=1 Tax=Aromia moschata TaxID=1265417 RepID=A0AAV8ZD92_9CUCU|nr:hypothetical protein NQ318_018158 [Aromia moschata]